MSGTIGTLHQNKPMRLVAKVTARDIALGIRQSVDQDPIARALTRAAEAEGISIADIMVIGQQAELYAWGYGNGEGMGIDYMRLEAARPQHAVDFVMDFDYGDPVKPTQITFIVREIIKGRVD